MLARMTLKPGSVAANVIPRRSGTDENVHLHLDAGIAIYATERDSVNLAVMRTAERRAAYPAKTEAPSRC